MMKFKGSSPFVLGGQKPALQPHELVILHLEISDPQPARIAAWVEQTNSITSQLYVDVPEAMLNKEKYSPILQNARTLVVRTYAQSDSSHYHGVIASYSGDPDLLSKVDGWQKLYPYAKILVSFNVAFTDIVILGPTIFRLYQSGHKIFFLDTQYRPTLEKIKEIKDGLEFLNMVGASDIHIYFSFFNEYRRSWELLTQSTFSGLREVHIDLSNRCTHSCEFCGLYGKRAIDNEKAKHSGSISADLKRLMGLEVSFERAKSFIESLPWTVNGIQFGGMGDPLMHPHAIDLIEIARHRGFCVELLTNMEYLDEEKMLRLHKLGREYPAHLHFIVNCSGATADVYKKTRPKQSEKTFNKILHNIKFLSKLRNENSGCGVHFTLMPVITQNNYRQIIEFIELAKEVGAEKLYLKPLEIHSEWMTNYLLNKEQFAEYKSLLRDALPYADKLKVSLLNREMLDTLL